MDDAFNTYTQSRYVSHLLPLLKLGRSHSLMEPIISAYSRKAELLPPPNMSSPMVKRTKLIAYVHFAPLKSSASTFALLMPISHPLAVSSLASLSTPIPRTGVRRGVGNYIRRHAMRLRTRQDPQTLLSGLTKEI